MDLRVFPYDGGVHPLLGASMAILEFRDAPDLDIVYVEQYRGTHHFEKRPAEVARCRDRFARLTERCLGNRQTIDLIETALGRYR
ncbi:hypothetical protein Ade02nite_81010 [Paractinoplanes deccanensis]|uniref:DUF5753 domain-containing protein n=1 Tax=Paractinoplanes deccanensis TaxID=113561 RepID=A0ABQ3YHG5_9ACTN|nr:Scr1 family TA system antitoxin-like transcriptional regulator [Actinoplanes deccanensis]GID79460.1 hypothetical protein Ade02nite_81010 [Actinoplanes deccanensis]